MAKRNATPTVLIRNMEDGPRDYPLKDGGSVYLPPKGKPVHWAEVSEDVFSEALALAEKKGFIRVQRNETPFEVTPATATATTAASDGKEAAENG